MKKGIVRTSSVSLRRRSVIIDIAGHRADNLQGQPCQSQAVASEGQDRSRAKMPGSAAHENPPHENPFDRILLG